MSQSRLEKFREVLRRRQPDMTLLTDEVHKAQNISAMLRTADAVGIPEIHMVRPQSGKLIYHQTSGGSSRYTGVAIHETIGEAMSELRERGMALYLAHQSERCVAYREADFTRPFALVMGAELLGPSQEAIDAADEHLAIPMMGMVESYNVSVAAAIILQEAMHQRLAAGFYDRPWDEGEGNRERLFRWLHPKTARYLDRQGAEYPALDEDGDLVPDDRNRSG